MSRSLAKEAAIVGLAVAVSRILFVLILPRQALSMDVDGWHQVAAMLARGENPYTSGLMNWPPAWMQIIYFLSKLAAATGIRFLTLLQSFLIVADVVAATLAVLIAARFLQIERPARLLLFGLAANPILLFLTCQQRNFDVLPVIAILCFVIALLAYRESHDPVDWLLACFALGIGVLVKTFPLLLAPLFMLHSRQLPKRIGIFGAALVTGPAAIGLSVVYVLAPTDVLRSVIQYRPSAGSFGITGILQLAGLMDAIGIYQRIFPLLAIVALFLVGRWLRDLDDIEPQRLVLLVGVMLAALIAFGPGYAPPYIAWPLPFFVLTYPCFDRKWRQDLIAIWVVATLTLTIEYALLPYLGAFLLAAITPPPALWWISDTLSDQRVATLFRLPLFVSYVWLVVASRSRLMASLTLRDTFTDSLVHD